MRGIKIKNHRTSEGRRKSLGFLCLQLDQFHLLPPTAKRFDQTFSKFDGGEDVQAQTRIPDLKRKKKRV